LSYRRIKSYFQEIMMSEHSISTAKAAAAPANEAPSQALKRRSFVAASAVAGSFAAAAALWASRKPAVTVAKAASPAQPAQAAEGYRLSEHVKRYYQTTTL
jgi:hypothetical protein